MVSSRECFVGGFCRSRRARSLRAAHPRSLPSSLQRMCPASVCMARRSPLAVPAHPKIGRLSRTERRSTCWLSILSLSTRQRRAFSAALPGSELRGHRAHCSQVRSNLTAVLTPLPTTNYIRARPHRQDRRRRHARSAPRSVEAAGEADDRDRFPRVATRMTARNAVQVHARTVTPQ